MPKMDPVYPLAEAVRLFLPGGVWTVASLRTEIRKGRLQVERIAGKFGVTETAIEDMRRLCQERAKAPAYGSGETPEPEQRFGQSSIVDERKAQDAAKATLAALKRNLADTSEKNMSRQKRKAG